jgi:lycopene beta-cyclase
VISNIHKNYDYVFIGLGASNSLLLHQLYENNLLKDAEVLIIEPNLDTLNHKTFCFWSEDDDLISQLPWISKKWPNIRISKFNSQNIYPLQYRYISGSTINQYNNSILKEIKHHHLRISYTSPTLVINDKCVITIESNQIYASYVFDSRPPVFLTEKACQTKLLQSFIGWEVESDRTIFEEDTITLMDFAIPQNNSCQFVYILPFSNNKALIEITRFDESPILIDEANEALIQYIEKLDTNVTITRVEKGAIPMTTQDIEEENIGQKWIATGTRAGMLKPTSGYAFHSMYDHAQKITTSIKSGKDFIKQSPLYRYQFYDRILLSILKENATMGKQIFETLFHKSNPVTVLKFLREKTTLWDEIKIFKNLPKLLFIRYAIKDILIYKKNIGPVTVPIVISVIMLLLYFSGFTAINYVIIAVGFLLIGMPHGALDHLSLHRWKSKMGILSFVLKYLTGVFIFALLWIFLPSVALLCFIILSAWHFGQTDFKEWHIAQNLIAFFWGFNVLQILLLFHFDETLLILSQIGHLEIAHYLETVQPIAIKWLQFSALANTVVLWLLTKSKKLIKTAAYLYALSFLPITVAFAIYFIFQHSLQGWIHLQSELKESTGNMLLKSLPFSIGGIAIILCGLILVDQSHLSMFYILLSCISIPHIYFMHKLYRSQDLA